MNPGRRKDPGAGRITSQLQSISQPSARQVPPPDSAGTWARRNRTSPGASIPNRRYSKDFKDREARRFREGRRRAHPFHLLWIEHAGGDVRGLREGNSRNPWSIPLIEPYIVITCHPEGVRLREGLSRAGREIPGRASRWRGRGPGVEGFAHTKEVVSCWWSSASFPSAAGRASGER